jgi:hypothetical protein
MQGRRKGYFMASVTATGTLGSQRPGIITWAVVLSVVPTLLSFPSFLLPGGDEAGVEALVVTVLLTIPTLIGAWGLWNCRKWGAITLGIPLAINILTSVPGLIFAPSGWLVASIIVQTPPAIVALVLLVHPNSRAVYR